MTDLANVLRSLSRVGFSMAGRQAIDHLMNLHQGFDCGSQIPPDDIYSTKLPKTQWKYALVYNAEQRSKFIIVITASKVPVFQVQ